MPGSAHLHEFKKLQMRSSSKKLEVGAAGTEARAKWGEGWVAESDKDEE